MSWLQRLRGGKLVREMVMSGLEELAPGFWGRVIGPRNLGYQRARALLRPGERLYVVHDQVIRKVAVPVPDESAFLRTDAQYGTGMSVEYAFAAGGPRPGVVVIMDGKGTQS